MSKSILPQLLIVSAYLLLASFSSYAQQQQTHSSSQLNLSSSRCIALHKGQTCYLQVTLSWHTAERKDACLVVGEKNRELKCWQQQQQGEMSFEFSSNHSQQIQLIDQSGAVLATQQIEVAWVYRSSKRNNATWRLF